MVAPCGRVRFITRVATRYLKEHFGPRRERHRLPEPLASWARTKPETPFCLVRNGRIFFVRLIDRSRKGAQHFLLEQRVVVEEILTAQEWVVMCWLRKGKTAEQIGEIMGRRVGTVKKHLSRIYDKLGVENHTAAASYADPFFNGEV